jgi:tetratricopeptide (TPR) repeat protein
MSEDPQPTKAVEVFYSYSHKDEELRDALEDHLSLLRRQGVISNWHDRGIGAGSEWAGEIDEHLKTADIILLLVSASFLASDYCYDVELKLAMERHEAGEARVIPVILKSCDWTSAPFGKLQALPKNALPLTKWPDHDEAFTDVAKGIRKAAEALVSKRRSGDSTSAGPAEKVEGAGKSAASLIPRPPIVGFVARRDEQGRDIVERLAEELAPDKNQLVALWGPGGTGKTTLAAEVVRATADVIKGRVAWVSALGRAEFNLATLLDETATQLGREDLRRLAPEQKSAQVSALVASRPTLVVLDNFETVTEAEQKHCLDFLARNSACPALITTRSFVNRDGVSNVPLAAMSIEEARDFLQRLVERTRKPSNFDRLDRDDLIQRCEANPLVLQWVVRQIDLAKRPQDVLNDLAQGEGDAAKRVFARSFNLPQLGDDGRAALLALSLFTPDASRAALAEVSGFGGDDLRRLDKAIEGLSALWLVETTEGNERLFLRGLTRELSKSRRSKDTGGVEFQRRFVAYFLRYGNENAQPIPEKLDALEAEKDNLLSAMDAAFGMQEWEWGMQMRSTLDYFFLLRGYWDEAIKTGRQAEAAARNAQNSQGIAHFTANVALIRCYRGEYEEAKIVYQEALGMFRKLNDEKNVAVCLHQLGTIAQGRGDLEKALRLYDQSLKIERKLRNQSGIARTTSQLGIALLAQGKFDESKQKHEESLVIRRNLDEPQGVAIDLHQLAVLAHRQGDLGEARRLYNESLEIDNRLGDQNGIAITLLNLGLLAEKEGNKADAARLLHEALTIFEKLGSPEAEKVRRSLARVEGEPD